MECEGFEHADIVFITDGKCVLSKEYAEELHHKQVANTFKITGILLDTRNTINNFSLEAFCQQVYRTSTLLAENIAERIILDHI